jgi:ribonucleoside-diphosphate reductase alpha chain
MIKSIIKRSGKEEEFSAEKVNGWGEWAAKALHGRVDWGEAVLHAVSVLPEKCSSEDLQNALIDFCLNKKTWEYNLMAGRLYYGLIVKKFYGKKVPTVRDLHRQMIDYGLLVDMGYSDEEYEEIEHIINHKLDLKNTHFEIHQIRHKYALRDKIAGKEFETPQFVYMRMAMALSQFEKDRIENIRRFYDHFSHKRINVPTPYYTNLGTKMNGFASCCVYTTHDTAPSLAAGDHIGYMMTVMSAGIGSHIKTRSLGDSIRNGLIVHQGKIPYYRALVGAVGANLQNGRGGAATVYYTAFDPEVEVIAKLKNPMTPAVKQVRGCDYSFGSNKFFAKKAALDEDVALFSYGDAPELYEAQYGSSEEFEQKYNEFLQSDKPRTMISARKLLVMILNEGYETGRHYLHFFDEMNTHTPFKDKIYSSNLCAEIALPTKGYASVKELYEPYQEGNGEIGLCNIGGIIVSNVENDEQYADVAYYVLKMIDFGIHYSDYVFKNLEDTAKSRLSAGVGILGLAHLMAKKNKKYSTQDGKDFIHEVCETHSWHLINASLRLGKERGNAPWMHKTKWPEGWLPIDTYNKKVDNLVSAGNKRDWESLRKRIIENGGIRNSVCIAHMPGESSSLGSGTTNGPYPIRDYDLVKTNETMVLNYVAPDSTVLKDKYEIAWEIPSEDLIDCYAIMQKWTDQAISCDLYRKVQGDEKVGSSEMIKLYLRMAKYGVKTRYYINSKTAKGIDLNATEVCESCSL